MIFIYFGLLRSLYCKISYLRAEEHWEFDNLHMTQCAKIIVGFMANVGNVFYPTFTNVFFIFSTFFTFFLIFISTFITSVPQSAAKGMCSRSQATDLAVYAKSFPLNLIPPIFKSWLPNHPTLSKAHETKPSFTYYITHHSQTWEQLELTAHALETYYIIREPMDQYKLKGSTDRPFTDKQLRHAITYQGLHRMISHRAV